MSLDFAPAIRATLMADVAITGLLTEWNGEAAIFTRRPVPTNAVSPIIVVSPDVSVTDIDALVSRRPVVVRDIIVYGDQPDHYRTVEVLGYLIREMFHRQRLSISPADYQVIDIIATGPRPAPTDDDTTVARVVTLTITARYAP
jgi:hypothetical protein